jgi:hypothetical protein
VRASTAGGHLSLFNLSGTAADATVAVPQGAGALTLFAGAQTVTRTGTAYRARLGAATAAVAAARFTLRAAAGRIPDGLTAEVRDAATVVLTGPACRLVLTDACGRTVRVTLRAGRPREVTLPGATPYPLSDVALGRITFPTSPLPAGMSDPAAAVDGDPRTSWAPGPGGRMVVDLGAVVQVGEVSAVWTTGRAPAARVEFSTDGLAYTTAGVLTGRTGTLRTGGSARYVALAVPDGTAPGACLTSLVVREADGG